MCATAEGQHRNWGTVAGDTAAGATAGAAIGNVPGAIVGGAVGFLTGLFTSDTPDPLAPPTPPPPPPDLADEIGRRADLAKQMRIMASGTGTYASGPLGDTSNTPGSAPKAGGY